jgi:hypothetical protein
MNASFPKCVRLILAIGCLFGTFHKSVFSGEFLMLSQFSGGANLGWLSENSPSAGWELSYTFAVFTGSLGAQHLRGETKYVYGEACIWMYANLGFGGGIATTDASTYGSGHLFLGLPFPIFGFQNLPNEFPGYFLFVEPYWRPIIQFDGWKSIGNEFGIFLKFGYRLEWD